MAGQIVESRLRVGLDRIKPFVLKLGVFSVAVMMSICLIILLVRPIGSESLEELGVGDRLHALGCLVRGL